MSNQDLRVKSEDQLPEGWRLVSLRDIIIEAQPGFACGTRSPDGVIQLRMNNIDTRGNFVWDEFIRVPVDSEIIKKYEITEGDILFNNTNSVELVGKSAIFHGYHEPVVYSNHFTRIKVEKSRNDPSYLAKWLVLQRHLGIFTALCNRWVGQSALKNDQLFTLSIPLPPTLEEQKRIAGILNAQMAAVEKARAAAEVRLETAKALPAAYLRKALPQSGQELPNGWQWSQLGGVCSAVRGVTFPAADPIHQPADGYVACLTTSAVQDEVAWGSRRYIPESSMSGSFQFLRTGDLLVSTANSKELVGKSSLVTNLEERATFGAFVTVLRPKVEVLPRFLAYLLRRRETIDFCYESSSNTTGISNLRVSDLLGFMVPIPPLDEQKRIAVMLNKQMEAVGNIFQTIHQELEAINALPSSLLRKAFSGGF